MGSDVNQATETEQKKRDLKTLTHQTRRFASYAAIPKTYRELCELCLPRPIHDDAQEEEATAMMIALAGFTRLNAEQQDYLDVLTEFVDEYDKGKKIRLPKSAAWTAQMPVGMIWNPAKTLSRCQKFSGTTACHPTPVPR